MSISDIKKSLDSLGKEKLGFYPTHLHKLEKLSSDLGVNLFLKREDLSGVSLFGGNKIRKLQYLMSQAKQEGCDTVFTYGATQSNHVMQTATAARICGLKPVVWLAALVTPDPKDVRANTLLDTILGAEIHILSSAGSTRATMDKHKEQIEAYRQKLASEGHKVFDIPVGGSTPRGAVGFAEAYIELYEQLQERQIPLDYLCTTTGSTGTLAGLLAGRALLDDEKTKVIGIQVGKKDPVTYKQSILQLAQNAVNLVSKDKTVTDKNLAIYADYIGPGYEIPYSEANDDIRYLARSEGILTDPVYSGKAFHGVLDLIRKGTIEKGSNVVFLHTGGATALFAEADIIGDLNELK